MVDIMWPVKCGFVSLSSLQSRVVMMNECGYSNSYVGFNSSAHRSLYRISPTQKFANGTYDSIPLVMKPSQCTPQRDEINPHVLSNNEIDQQLGPHCNGGNDHVVIMFPMQRHQKKGMSRRKPSKLHSVYTRYSNRLTSWISDMGKNQNLKSSLWRLVSCYPRGYRKLSPLTVSERPLKMPNCDDGAEFLLVLEKINEVLRSMEKRPKKTHLHSLHNRFIIEKTF